MKFFVYLALFIGIMIIGMSIQTTQASPTANKLELEKENALEFLYQDHGLNLEKRFIYTGKEQRREAKENYEEKCERSALSRIRGKPRWCPELKL